MKLLKQIASLKLRTVFSYRFVINFIIISTLLFQTISYLPKLANASTLLSDNFTGTTINTSNWTESDAGGIGGTVGNIQQNGSLSMTGPGGWGEDYLLTTSTYDRSLGGLQMDADVTCVSGSSIFGIGFGDPGVLSGGGESYTLYAVSHDLSFSRQSGNSNAESTVTGFSCADGVPFHIKITIGTTTGAAVYINGSGTPAVTLTGGSFNHKGFFLEGHSGSTLVDNVVISGLSGATAPDAPTSLAATPASGQMALTWTAPVSNGGSAITDYLVEYKTSAGPTWGTFADGTSTTTSALVTGLSNGVSYDFRVSAINAIGTGSPSSTATATPALSTPTAPQGLAATSYNNSQSTLTWTAPLSNGGASITDYIVEYKLSTEPTVWTTFADGTSATTGATVTGLTNNSLYNFRVSAVNSVGTGTVSSTASATPSSVTMTDNFTGTTIDTSKWNEHDAGGLGGTVGDVTQNGSLSIVPTAGNWSAQNGLSTVNTYDRTNGDVSMQFAVTRTNCGNGVGPVAMGYGDMDFTVSGSESYIFISNGGNWELYYWANGTSVQGPITLSSTTSCSNGVPITFKLVAFQNGGAAVYVNGSGTPEATINTGTKGTFTNEGFWIGGMNASGTVSYDDVVVVEPTAGPFAPTGLTPAAGDGQVGLNWTSGGDNGATITDYKIEYKLNSSGSWSIFSDGTSAATSTTVTGLTNGQLYNFRVSAINSNGTSTPSSTANSTPISATPAAPVATNVSISGVASVGELITGIYTFTDANGNTEGSSMYRWLRSDTLGGTYLAISGATSINYTVTSGDLTKYLKFEVTPVSNTAPTTGSPVSSSASAQVSQVDFINQIVSTGQSLSVGVGGSPALSLSQPYSNIMLTGGGGGIGTGTTFTPLVESGVETMGSSIANTITANVPGHNYTVLVSNHGVSGYTYSQLKKGTDPYNIGMTQITNVKNAAITAGKQSRVIGFTAIHGETDNFNGVDGPTYEGYLVEWQHDLQADTEAITGQNGTIPFFTDQMSSYFSSYANTPTSEIPIYQLAAAEDHPGTFVLVTPKYFFNYSDRHHLTNESYRWLGEYYGKVMKKVVVDHQAWRPLSTDSVTRNGSTIYAKFHVPAGVLAFDTTIEQPITNKGFEYYDTTSSASISSVSIVNSDTVAVVLNHPPTGSNQRLRYAYTGVAGVDAGSHSAGAAGGNLRDTDTYPSANGNTLYDWSVHFDKPISEDSTAPTVSNLVSATSATSATVTWNTNEEASSLVDYGLTSSYVSSTTETDITPRVLNHSVSLTGLVACTTYHFRVKSKDAGFNLVTGSDSTFTTTGCSGSSEILDQTNAAVTSGASGSLSLTTGGNSVGLTIPSGSTSTNAIFEIQELGKTAAFTGISAPTGYTLLGNYAYSLKAYSDLSTLITSFTHPLTVTFTYISADIDNADASSLVIYRLDSGVWTKLDGCTVDTTAKTVSCTTSNFSVFALAGVTHPSIATVFSGNSSSSGSSDSSPAPEGCSESKPSNAPDLFEISAKNTSATLYFSPTSDNTNKYFVSYGNQENIPLYGAEFGVVHDNKGVQKVEISKLKPNTTYYFKVRGGHDCAPGEWSNSIGTKTTGSSSASRSSYKWSSFPSIVKNAVATLLKQKANPSTEVVTPSSDQNVAPKKDTSANKATTSTIIPSNKTAKAKSCFLFICW